MGDALKQVEHIHSSLFGTEPEEPPAEAVEEVKPKRRPAPPPEPEVMIPMYRLQYTKDDKGRYASVELKCTFPVLIEPGMARAKYSKKREELSISVPAKVVD